jgi:hypothetical protein
VANTIITPAIIAKEAAIQVVNSLVFARLANKQFKNDFGVKIGDTVAYRKPVRFVTTDGPVLSMQDVTEESDNIVINKHKHVGWNFDVKSLTLSIDEYSERYIKPAAIALANQLDFDGADLYKAVYNASGTAGGEVDFDALLDTKQKLTEFAVMQNDRFAALTPKAATQLLKSLTSGVFQPSLVEDITKEASVGRLAGLDLYEGQNVKNHTKGTALTITLASNPDEGATSVSLTAGTPGTLVEGDIITFQVTNAVNPINKQDLGYAAQFVVTATTAVTTATSVPISPALRATGAYQNVTALPTTGAAVVTLVGSHAANLAFQRNAFALVSVPFQAPDGVSWSESVEYQGISLTMVKAFDIVNYREIVRLDTMYGWKATYPDLACRILGNV